VADFVGMYVTYSVRQVVQDALKFLNHSARRCLSTEDVDRALALRGLPPLYGFHAPTHLTFKQAPGMPDLFYLENAEVKFEDLLNAELPPPPVDPTFSVHWLAVEGIQPAIPQNPSIEAIEAKNKIKNSSSNSHFQFSRNLGELAGGMGAESAVSEEGSANAAGGDQAVKVKPLVKHILSKEQVMYFEHVKLAITRIDEADHRLLKAALTSLSTDAGLHQLLPYFTQFISDEVARNTRNLPLLMNVMKMAKSILTSKHLFVEPYVSFKPFLSYDLNFL
jgi:transcription initiation factor TFIID subunit 6